ncbi:hypothetical protein ES703_31618 [subsurface metagenome]
MDKKSYRVLTLTAACMLFLSTSAQQAIAWPCLGGCPACYTCTETGCECRAQCGCGGRTCSGCCVCSGCSCVPGSCPDCESCVGCQCEGSPCGDEPTQEQRERFEDAFPNLEWGQWSITGDADDVYNCIAWSAGETDVWYNKISNDNSDPDHPITGIDETFGDNDGVFEISDMDAFYDAKGYEPTGTGPEDADIMYYTGYHAAKKTDYGMYESKCGTWEKIDHVWDQLNGDTYGTPTRYYKQK